MKKKYNFEYDIETKKAIDEIKYYLEKTTNQRVTINDAIVYALKEQAGIIRNIESDTDYNTD